MKKTYLTPEVELFEVQQTTALLSGSGKDETTVPMGPGHADGNGDDETVKDFVFEW